MFKSEELVLDRDTSEEVVSIKDKLNVFEGNTPFVQLCLSLFFALPASAWANEYLVQKVENIINWGFWAILFGSIAGGVASTFINTEVDDKLSHDTVAKLLIGTSLGFFACVSYIAYYPETVALKLALPSFVLGCLGAPIIVFLLTWASDPATFRKASRQLDRKLGLEEESNSSGSNNKGE